MNVTLHVNYTLIKVKKIKIKIVFKVSMMQKRSDIIFLKIYVCVKLKHTHTQEMTQWEMSEDMSGRCLERRKPSSQ